jgi:splicing factor 3B subunit 2
VRRESYFAGYRRVTLMRRYYEGKELETDLRTKKPGELSEELIEALSIPPLAPPPWLIAMQRFGPPPSYPNLRIRGLNAPIPSG